MARSDLEHLSCLSVRSSQLRTAYISRQPRLYPKAQEDHHLYHQLCRPPSTALQQAKSRPRSSLDSVVSAAKSSSNVVYGPISVLSVQSRMNDYTFNQHSIAAASSPWSGGSWSAGLGVGQLHLEPDSSVSSYSILVLPANNLPSPITLL